MIQTLLEKIFKSIGLIDASVLEQAPLVTTCVAKTLSNKFIVRFIDADIWQALYQVDRTQLLELFTLRDQALDQCVVKQFNIPRFFHPRQQEGQYIVEAYNYIDGQVKTLDQYSKEQISLMGKTLASIHSFPLDCISNQYASARKTFIINTLNSISQQFNIQNKDLWQLITRHFSLQVRELIKQQIARLKTLDLQKFNFKDHNLFVFAHLDFHPKHIVWQDKTHFAILDWKDLSPVFRSTDLLNSLTTFSYKIKDNQYILDQERHDAFIKGYKQVYPRQVKFTAEDFAMVIAVWTSNFVSQESMGNAQKAQHCKRMIDFLFLYHKTQDQKRM